ncbi:uncharacterized protein LOC117646615 isoform X2 [Thrips palmi]|uniref:Uncharacterized protein LOC117646615 isoform X2 n=1 Tax=Thrips palmi TaxID=161013 RepID=A0A6P8Z0T6_THRPL|nr:uncharacterized protein LOC117646615 isoform X2 [Thrips palmi]
MDPFVPSRIGDVTIQRVSSRNNSSEEPKDELPSEGSAATMENLPVSPKDELVENETVKSPKAASPDQIVKAEKPSNEAENGMEASEKSDDASEKKDGIQNEVAVIEDQKSSEEAEPAVEPKAETIENENYEAGREEFEGEQVDEEGDVDDDEGPMDASQFLEMAQAEDEDENEMAFDKTGEDFLKEEPQENEDDLGNEPIRKKKRKANVSPSDVKQEAPDEDEGMDEDVNGAMEDGDYAAGESGDDFDEGDDLAEGNYEDEDERNENSGMKSIKSEPEDTSSKKPEEEGDDEGNETKDDVKKKLRSRQKRKVLVEEDTDESEEERKKKRKKRKKKGDGETSEETESEDDGSGKKKKKKKKKKPGKKSKKKDDDDDGSGGEKEGKKSSNMRRNIRDVMDETQLDEATLAAQRQEMERLRRVQEQQRVLREMAIQRQQQQRADRVMSLLQGKTSLLKQVSVGPAQASKSGTSATSPNTVVVKVGSGATAQSNKKVLELLKVPKDSQDDMKPSVTKTLISKPIQGTTMMTPSVSIAPVRPSGSGQRPASAVKQPSFIQAQASYSASEGEEEEEEEEILEDGELEEGEGEVDEEGKKKKKDVVTISSSSSSEDDCIVLSEPSDDGEEEEGEDPTNSGMHTNDSFNVPDDEGRVQVNMGKPEGDPDIFLAPHIARLIKPHQIGGIRFLYDNVVESIERFSTSTGFGCILAHSMGLGKTLQVITFCDIFLRHTPAKTVMCIMPINTLQNWLSEFNMWMPDDPLATPLAVQGEVRPRTFGIFVLNDSHKTLKARAKVVDDWTTNGGVLLIGYEMYRQLSLKKMSKPKKSRRKRPISDDEELDPEEEEKRQKEMLEKVFEALVKPGPDLVICDEGHRIKNSHASISLALKQIRTKRRVVLTGYPLQNNLLEYWCMVDFVRPNYLGTKTEFCNMFERPIQNGQCIDSTPQDIRLMRYRAHVLHSLLEGFVQRRSHSVLTNALPQKEEYVLLVRLTPFQRKLYDTFMNEVVRTKAVPNPLKAFAVCCKIWNHPDVLYQFLKKREGGEGVDLDLEEAAAALAANTVTDPTGTPIEERKAATKGRPRGSTNKNRKKKEVSPTKPAATVLPNTSSHSDHSNPYNLSSQYPMHGQMNSNSSMMGSYNPYSGSGQSPYGSFNAHHYNPSSSYGHAGYSGPSGAFNASSSSLGLNATGQGSFSGSGSSGYGDSLASSPASQSSQYGSSSSQSMFSGSSSNNPSSSSTSAYGSMGPPYFGGNGPSGQHSMTDSFPPGSNYNQSWSGNSSYNSFNQGPSGSQAFPGSSYSGSGQSQGSQGAPFQGYGSSGSSSSFNQSMYGSGSASSSSSSTQQFGLMDQQMLDPGLMAPPSRPNPNLNPNLIPQQSPVNASGMLPGGAPTKNPAMMPSGMMGSGMGAGMGNAAPGMSGMNENMMGHNPQSMGMSSGVYQNPNIMNLPSNPPNQTQTGSMALSGMSSTDAPSAEDLLHSSDDFRAFDASLSKMDPGRGMYDVKDRNMFDPWGNSHGHPQDFNIINSQDMKPLQNSGLKKSENEKFSPGPSPLDQLKNDMGDVKLEEKPIVKDDELGLSSKSGASNQTDQDTKAADEGDSWRVDSMEIVDKDKEGQDDIKDKEGKEDEEEGALGAEGKPLVEPTAIIKPSGKEDPGIPYDWAVELMKDYVPGLVENSAKMVLFLCILEEALALGDRILLFSQSLFTLSLIEDYLQRSFIPVPGVYERWQRNRTYFRLDGSTAALEREKLINEFNANPNVFLFLVSTRAGSLGINLVGANRVIVFDASWNPCHDTQAVCRVYRYGQKKPCYVYRFVMDNCLEKKIYDRQINKQGMSDRVVDECNPDAHLSIKEVTNLCWDEEKESEIKDLSSEKDNYTDTAMQKIVEKHGKLLTKAPFQHESLLVDRKDKKLSQAEKRLAKRSYEMEKRANNRPVYNYYNANQGGLQIRPVQRDAAGNIIKPIASVRPIQSEMNSGLGTGNRNTKWIPAEVWQRQGMSAQEMTLPLDVVIPTNSPERSSIVLKAGQRVMVLKSPKGIYMQLENGKIIAIRTAFKSALGGNNKTEGNKPFAADKEDLKKGVNVGVVNKGNMKLSSGIHPLRNNPNITITPRAAPGAVRPGIRPILNRTPGGRMQTTANMRPWVRPGGVAGRAVPIRPGQNIRPGIRGLNPSVTVTPASAKTRTLGPVTITPRLAPATNFPGLKTFDKDKAKTESKSDGKLERSERVESEDGQSSNSSLDIPSSSSSKGNDSIPPKTDDKGDKLRGDPQGGDPDSNFSKATASDLTKIYNDGSAENKSSDGFSDKQGNSRSQDHLLNKATDLSSSLNSNASSFSSNAYNADKGSFPGSFPTSSSSVSKQYNANMQSGSMMTSSNFNTPTDLSVEDKSSSHIENQWKSPPAPQAFSPGVPAPSSKSTSQQRRLESPALDDNSNNSAHSNISSKSSTAHGSSLESRAPPSGEGGVSSYVGTDLSTSHSKTSNKLSSSNVSSSQSSSSSTKLNPSSTSSSVPTTTASNFPPLDPYANLYGSYGAYPGALPTSNYYNPYSYSAGFLPDPKTSLSNKSSTEPNPSTPVPSSRSSSKSTSRSESKKSSHESPRSSLPAAYESRQPSSSSSTSATHSSRSSGSSASTSAASSAVGSSSAASDTAAFSSSSSAAAAAAAYNPMMMSPSFNPTSCQYPPPPSAAGSANPFTAAAAAAANYTNPYAASPYGYTPNQFDAMYSAFHRPEAGLDPTSPYLRPMPGAAPPAGSFYPQNVYGSQYGSARDPYGQIPPYPGSPFIMPPAPYGGLASSATSASSTATSDQSTSQ